VSDLIEEYFKRDLTEEEEARLAESLASSPEDAGRLAEGLARMYHASGLPEPVWPGGTPPWKQPQSWVQKPIVPLALLALGLGFMAYKWFTYVPQASLAPRVPAIPAPPREESLQKNRDIPESLPLRKKSPARIEVPSPTDHLVAPPDRNPSGHVYEQLSIVVEPKAPGLVTVRVKDANGVEIRDLYAGIIPAGKRVFSWDGKKEDGQLAAPGVYTLELQSGQKIMRREVKVEGN